MPRPTKRSSRRPPKAAGVAEFDYVRRFEAKPIGTMYTIQNESDIAELSLGCSGLRVVVETNPNGSEERLLVEYQFEAPRGFRFLDECDLIRYWEKQDFYARVPLVQSSFRWLVRTRETGARNVERDSGSGHIPRVVHLHNERLRQRTTACSRPAAKNSGGRMMPDHSNSRKSLLLGYHGD